MECAELGVRWPGKHAVKEIRVDALACFLLSGRPEIHGDTRAIACRGLLRRRYVGVGAHGIQLHERVSILAVDPLGVTAIGRDGWRRGSTASADPDVVGDETCDHRHLVVRGGNGQDPAIVERSIWSTAA